MYIENIRVILYDKEFLFFNNKTKKIFNVIKSIYFMPVDQENQHEVIINLIRDSKLFDRGKYEYCNKDDKAFILNKIIPQYFESIGSQQKFAYDGLIPFVFKVGDMMQIIHNSRESFCEQIKAYSPTYTELKNQNLPFKEIEERLKTKKEVFPKVYRL